MTAAPMTDLFTTPPAGMTRAKGNAMRLITSKRSVW